MSRIRCFMVTVTGNGSFMMPDGSAIAYDQLPPGAMWYADWYSRKGSDGQHLIVKTPGGIWQIDNRASNCTLPDDDEHRCWVRHGDAPDITVDKNGKTCGCGCSIGIGPGFRDYHGFLRNGHLETA